MTHTVSEDFSARTESAVELGDRLRSFLMEHHPGRAPRGSRRDRTDWQQRWSATLFDHGFAGPSWPVEHGGMDLDLDSQVVYYDEIAQAKVPPHPGNGPSIAGPTIIRHGTPEQQQKYLRPMLRADQVWAQGFSEPAAGSDLPSLITQARREGDNYVVRGHKIWCSNADVADMMIVLVRTGPGLRAEGITYLIVDLCSHGILIQPIKDMAGGQHFCEVFFDDVRVPVANRVGEEGQGWGVARTSLGHERATRALSQAALFRRVLTELKELPSMSGEPLPPSMRDRLAKFEIRVRIMGYNAQRTIDSIRRRGEPDAASSVSRLSQSLLEQDLYETAVDILGAQALLTGVVQGGRWTTNFLRSRAATIGTGTAEIQRNTIAEHVLGLPRESNESAVQTNT